MGDKRCCIHNQDAAQFLYILRLEDDEDDAGNRYHDKRFVDHAGSYLIAVAGAYEVDGTDDGEQDNETQVQYLMVGNLRIITEFAVVDFGIVSTPFETKQAVKSLPVQEIRNVFIAGPKYAAQLKGRKLSYKELLNCPCIFLERNTSTRRFMDEFLAKRGVRLEPQKDRSAQRKGIHVLGSAIDGRR